MLRRKRVQGKREFPNVKKKATESENGIYPDLREPCSGKHLEYLEDHSIIWGGGGWIARGWSYKFRCPDCNAARNESRYFDERNSLGG